MNNEAAIGIDIGGTNTVFSVISKDGEILFKDSVLTESHKPAEELFGKIFSNIDERIASMEYKPDIKGIGIGAPNANYYTGEIESPPNLLWGTVNIEKICKKHRDLPVFITNDANAAALGEMIYGAAKGMNDFVEITLGTGLGAGVVVNGKMVYGSTGFAGELGHIIVKEGGRMCGCGRRGCLETYASATGLKRTALEIMADSNISSPLRKFTADELNSRNIYDAAESGDLMAEAAFEFTGKFLGAAVCSLIAVLSPAAVVLFGGLADAGRYIFDPTMKFIQKNSLHVLKDSCKLLPSSLPEGNAAVLGAGALVWHELEKKELEDILNIV